MILLLGIVILFIFGGFMFFQNMQDASYTYHENSNQSYLTNNSENGYTEISLAYSYDGIENESLEAWDPENPSADLTRENFTLADEENGLVNVTNYYQEDPSIHEISFNYTSRESSSFTAPINIGFGFLKMLEGFMGILGWLIAAVLMMVALYAAIKLSGGSGGGSA